MEDEFYMPNYDMKCKSCNNEFTVMASIKAKEEGEIACPKCGGNDVFQVFKSMNFVRGGSGVNSSGSACGAGGCGSCHACSA